MRILHISADFPDPLVPVKTKSIINLLELVPEFEHMVYSLNRVSARHRVAAVPFGADWRAVTYGSPPYGVLLRRGLDRVAKFILEDIARRGLRIDLVHGHKISVEGPIAKVVAEALGVPYFLSSMGDTDHKIIRAKPELRGLYRRVWRGAAAALPSAPWTADGLEAMLGPRGGPVRVIPLPTKQDAIRTPAIVGPIIRSTFHLASHRRKNAEALIAAAAKAARSMPDLRLDIVGGGDAEGFATLFAAVQATDPDRIRLLGPVANDQIGDFMHNSGGFALVSRRETYGMVYVEALLSGVPVLHAAGNGIAGYLEDGLITLTAPHDDSDAITEALLRLAREEEPMKARIAEMQNAGALDIFRRAAVAEGYRTAIAEWAGAPAATESS